MSASQAQTLWAELEALPRPSLTTLFDDAGRLARYSTTLDLPGGPVIFDWSKTHLSPQVEDALTAIATAMVPFLLAAIMVSWFGLQRRKWQQGEAND